MRLVIRDARALIRGALIHADIVIEDGEIVSITRSYRGPYDEKLEANGAIAMPGLTDPFVCASEPHELMELARSGVTQALVYIPAKERAEFFNAYYELYKHSPIDLGFRSDNPAMTPQEVIGYVARDERILYTLREAYDRVLVAITYFSGRRRILKKASRMGFKTIVIDPEEPVYGYDVLALAPERLLRGDPKLMFFAFRTINSRSKYLFTRASAPLAVSLIMRGISSRTLIERMNEHSRILGIRSGLSPGSRANLVLLRRKSRTLNGIKLYFETMATIVAGEIVYYENEFIGQPRIAIINQQGAYSYA